MILLKKPDYRHLLDAYGVRLRRFAGDAWMPRMRTDQPKVPDLYGGGSYGWALPTRTPGVTLKFTRDHEEAAFAAMTLAASDGHPGVVTYFKGCRMPQDTTGLVYYALWREEVKGPKSALFNIPEETPRRATKASAAIWRGWRSMIAILEWGDVARGTAYDLVVLDENPGAVPAAWKAAMQREMPPEEALRVVPDARHWRARGIAREFVEDALRRLTRAERLRVALSAVYAAARELAREDRFELVGQALAHYLARGALLYDVNRNNFGFARRAGRWRVVLSDPSQVVFLSPSLGALALPELPEIRAAKAVSMEDVRFPAPQRLTREEFVEELLGVNPSGLSLAQVEEALRLKGRLLGPTTASTTLRALERKGHVTHTGSRGSYRYVLVRR